MFFNVKKRFFLYFCVGKSVLKLDTVFQVSFKRFLKLSLKKTFFDIKNVFFIFLLQEIGSDVNTDTTGKFQKSFETTLLKNVF
jgi:hypothetical protein